MTRTSSPAPPILVICRAACSYSLRHARCPPPISCTLHHAPRTVCTVPCTVYPAPWSYCLCAGGGHFESLNLTSSHGVYGYYKQVYGAQSDPSISHLILTRAPPSSLEVSYMPFTTDSDYQLLTFKVGCRVASNRHPSTPTSQGPALPPLPSSRVTCLLFAVTRRPVIPSPPTPHSSQPHLSRLSTTHAHACTHTTARDCTRLHATAPRARACHPCMLASRLSPPHSKGSLW